MKYAKSVIVIIALLLALPACSSHDGNPLNPSPNYGSAGKTGLDSLPVVAFDGNTALGLFGAYNLMLSPEGAGAELVPMRTPSLGEAYIVSGTSFFTMTPCNTCLKVANVSLNADGNIVLGMKVKHPFPPGDPLKPPTGKNRLDLDVFDLALIVAPVDKTSVVYSQTASRVYPGIVLNADGYTTELANVIGETAALPYKVCYESAENNRFAMGTDYQDFQVEFAPDSGLTFNLYLTMGYGASAKKAERLHPTYYVPEFNRKAAWKVMVTPPQGSDPPAMGNTWDDHDATTPYTVTIDIYDWNHGATIAAIFPDPANTNQISAASDISSVTVEIPGMTSSIVTAVTSDTTQNGWDDPLTYTASFPNQNRLVYGVYKGLVKVSDSRVPGIPSVGGETNTLVHSGAGTLVWFDMPEFATYQVFDATVVLGALPPTCDIHPDTNTTGQGGVIMTDPGTSHDPDGNIAMYEYDASYDGTTFNAEVTQHDSDPDFGDPVPLMMPCNTTGNSITNKIALRVTDDGIPPMSTICSVDITVTTLLGSPRKVAADTVNRGEAIANQYRITSIDLDWPDNPCAVEYAIERANDGMNPTIWSVLASTTTSFYKFQPTDCMNVDRLRVKARAVIGGNPATDSAPSGEVLFMFDSAYWSNGHSWSECDEHQNGTHWNFSTSTWGFDSLDDVGNGGYGMASFSSVSYGGQAGSWANAWCAFMTRVPDVVDQDAAYVDMYYSQFQWEFGNTAAMMLGTASGLLPDNQPTANDFNGATRHRSFGQYNNACQALNDEFGETNAMGFSGVMNWTHVSYWLDGLLETDRDYFGIGWANGSMAGISGYGYNDSQVIVVY